MGEGGGVERSRSPYGLLPPIPALPSPTLGGRGPKSPVPPAQYRELNAPVMRSLLLWQGSHQYTIGLHSVGLRKMIVDAEGRLWYMGSHNGRLDVLG